jgi:TP901 family phage tail tape measure protein
VSVVANVAINIDGKQAQSLLKSIQSEVEKLNGSFGELEKPTKGFGASIKAAAGSVIGQLAAVAGAAFTLQQAFNTLAEQSRAEAALRSLGVNADVASSQFVKLSQDLQGQASSVELTAAAYDVASAGFLNVAEQTQILEASTKGAVGGMSDLNTVGNAVTSVLNAYGMSADQANKLVDGFIQTQNDGKIILAEYATQIGRLAPTAAAAGVGIDELNAAVSTITAQGVPVEATFTGLNQALVSILKPTKEAEDLARSLGIEFNETGLRTQGFGGLLAQVAQATGGSTTQLTKLFGSVDALKAVLPLVNDGLVGFNKNIDNQKNSTGVADKAFKEMSDTLQGAIKQLQSSFVALVVAFKPVTPAIIAPFKLLAGTLNLVAQNIKGVAMAATFLGTFAGILNASAIATKAWAIATAGLAAAKKAAGVAAAFLQGVMNPASLATTALALGAATAAAVTLGNAMGDAGVKAEEAKGKQGGIADETAKINAEIEKQLQGLDQVPPKQQAQADKATEVLGKLREQSSVIDAQIASLDRAASVTSARYATEKAFNDLQGQQLERQYGLAKTAQQRLDIAIAIFNQQVKAAEIEYRQALENIQLELRKLELQAQAAQLKYKEIEAEGQLQILKAGSAEEEAKKRAQLQEALAAQNQVVQATYDNASAQQQIAQYQEQTAAAQLESKMLAAQTALEQKLVSDKIGLSQTEAVRLSTGLKNSQSSAAQLSGSTNQVAQNALGAAGNFIRVANAADAAAASIGNAANQQARLNALRGGGGGGGAPVKQAADGAYWSGGFKAFADGGVVTQPTMGLVGEGGEPEYIIPASKMQEAMKRYAEGKRGNGVIPSTVSPQVNVTTGPVMSMNGQNYVSQRDLVSGLMSASRSTAESVIDMLRSDMSVRREIGLS